MLDPLTHRCALCVGGCVCLLWRALCICSTARDATDDEFGFARGGGGLAHAQHVEAQIGQLFTAVGLPAAFRWQEGFWVRALCAVTPLWIVCIMYDAVPMRGRRIAAHNVNISPRLRRAIFCRETQEMKDAPPEPEAAREHKNDTEYSRGTEAPDYNFHNPYPKKKKEEAVSEAMRSAKPAGATDDFELPAGIQRQYVGAYV